MNKVESQNSSNLNGICPYFTMFPLSFPQRILSARSKPGQTVLDPFCGRGTTNFAARLAGLYSVGVDSSPVASAISQSKIVSPTPDAIVAEARAILATADSAAAPEGEFWEWAFHARVLKDICRIRAALIEDCTSAERIALRAIVLGALHGPRQKTFPSYFSNQCPRTYAPKPAYSVRFWKQRALIPFEIDAISLIERRAKRYYTHHSGGSGLIRNADSRLRESLMPPTGQGAYDWVITSPPYYGMRTYIPDQWLRNWFVGGMDCVDYTNENQLVHSSPEQFVDDLRSVWHNACAGSNESAIMVMRFGGIADRRASPLDLAKESLKGSGWRIATVKAAGTATLGKRQANAFLRKKSDPLLEYDIWASR